MTATGIYEITASSLFDWGVPLLDVRYVAMAILATTSILVAWTLYAVLTRVVSPVVQRVAQRTAVTWDEILFNTDLMRKAWRLVAVVVLMAGLRESLKGFPGVASAVSTVMTVVIIAVTAMLVMQFIRTVFDIISEHTAAERENDDANDYNPTLLEERARTEPHSLGGVSQMLQLVVVLVALILTVSVLSGKNVVIILSGLGASAAVLMLVFRDTILGLVAGVQLTANDMLRPGDWISMPKYDVNGRVRRINLTTVKVQNYDNTIVTIPPYQLVSETFQNWRGMERSGGRRVMRSVAIDLQTVRFCTPEEIERWCAELWWGRVASPERPVNVSVFRAYLEHYVARQATLVPDMLFMIRELQPTACGLPVEVYFFTSSTSWADYEAVQAAVTDHVLAVTADFGLRVFQSPSGYDVSSRV